LVLDKITAKAQKITIKLPWEITTIYSEVLRQNGHQSDDEEDEDDIEAHEASIQRLKVFNQFSTSFYNIQLIFQEADDATRQMTREEYQHYSDCRQATFTYRKSKSLTFLFHIYTRLTFPSKQNASANSSTYHPLSN
jgi:transcription initiation protein SPT3